MILLLLSYANVIKASKMVRFIRTVRILRGETTESQNTLHSNWLRSKLVLDVDDAKITAIGILTTMRMDS